MEDDGGVVLDLDGGRYYSLNRTGAEIWSQLEKGKEPAEIVDHLVERFDQPASRMRRDFELFVAQLSKIGVLDVDG